MTAPLDAAREIVQSKADVPVIEVWDRESHPERAEKFEAEQGTDRPMESFVDQYSPPPGTHPATRVLIGDASIMCLGHSSNKAACVAISAAIQTTAAIGKELECVTEVTLDDSDRAQPIYKVEFVPGPVGARLTAGFLRSIAGIEKKAPGSVTVHDSRKKG